MRIGARRSSDSRKTSSEAMTPQPPLIEIDTIGVYTIPGRDREVVKGAERVAIAIVLIREIELVASVSR